MISTLSEGFQSFLNWTHSFNHQDWFLIMVGTVVIGFFLLRGFGSRKNY